MDFIGLKAPVHTLNKASVAFDQIQHINALMAVKFCAVTHRKAPGLYEHISCADHKIRLKFLKKSAHIVLRNAGISLRNQRPAFAGQFLPQTVKDLTDDYRRPELYAPFR